MVEIVESVMAEVTCESCSHILRKKIRVKPDTTEKKTSRIDIYCPFCKQYVKGTVKGDLYLGDRQTREDEMLRKFNLDNGDEA